jgi:hypothetical protein
MQIAIQRAVAKQPRAWQFPVLACHAMGGTGKHAVPAAAAIGCMQVSIILIDNLFDKVPWGEYHAIGEAAAANLASRFNLLSSRNALPDHQFRIVNFFNHLDNVLP